MQYTLHPVVVYYKKGQDIAHISYYILSDDLDHTIHLVYVIQKKVIQDLKTRLPNITSLEYSDGWWRTIQKLQKFPKSLFEQAGF